MTGCAPEDLGQLRFHVFLLGAICKQGLGICEYSIFVNATPECIGFTNKVNLRALALANMSGSQTDHS